ncbi:hypothetical protein [Phenylobacterium ferrooxidans]|uniref:Uncharacterized protein n=1 Tax=Phenylobacterium ferrooxidans TaxID=2982689 RepID=A0ABW6CMM2_9CAUL
MKVIEFTQPQIHRLDLVRPSMTAIAAFDDGYACKVYYDGRASNLTLYRKGNPKARYAFEREWVPNPKPAPERIAAVLVGIAPLYETELAKAREIQAAADTLQEAWDAEKTAYHQRRDAGPAMYELLREAMDFIQPFNRATELYDQIEAVLDQARGLDLKGYRITENPATGSSVRVRAPDAETALQRHVMTLAKRPAPDQFVVTEEQG